MSSLSSNLTTITQGDIPLTEDSRRELTYPQLMLSAAIIGITGGLVATCYYYLLESSLHLVWHQIPEILKSFSHRNFLSGNYVWIATTIGGLLVHCVLWAYLVKCL